METVVGLNGSFVATNQATVYRRLGEVGGGGGGGSCGEGGGGGGSGGSGGSGKSTAGGARAHQKPKGHLLAEGRDVRGSEARINAETEVAGAHAGEYLGASSAVGERERERESER